MLRRAIAVALAASTVLVIAPGTASAAQYRDGYNAGAQSGWDRNTFWQGAPDDPRQRISWLQRRIDRGIQDGSLDRREAYQSQRELNNIRRMSMRLRAPGGRLSESDRDMLQDRLDNLSQRLRWRRQEAAGYGDRGDMSRYRTDYDASRYYRSGDQYRERRLSSNDEVYRGSDGRYYCKRSDGTTGLIVGAAAGGLLGNIVDGGHNRVAGTLIGGALGAIAGKSIDQNSDVRCR